MKCSCGQKTMMIPSERKIVWTKGDTRGCPIHPPEPHPSGLCYYCFKKKEGYYDSNKFVGKESNPTIISSDGKKRVLGLDWR